MSLAATAAAPFPSDCMTCGSAGDALQAKAIAKHESMVAGNSGRAGAPAVPGLWEDCAPRMADGRLFTDYRPRCVANLEFAKPMTGSQDYRLFLIENGDKIMQQNRANASSAAFCAPCKRPFDQGTMPPEVDRVVCDKVSCARIPAANGSKEAIGTGRQYVSPPPPFAAASGDAPGATMTLSYP